MKVERRLLPLKAHYFCFLGCVAPILPFLMVVVLQLGVPVAVHGTVSAASLLFTVLGKPVFAGLADSFPSHRKVLFLAIVSVMVASYTSFIFIPPMRGAFSLHGRLEAGPDVADGGQKPGTNMLRAEADGECYVASAWDCLATCSHPWNCLNTTTGDTHVSQTLLQVSLVEQRDIGAPASDHGGPGTDGEAPVGDDGSSGSDVRAPEGEAEGGGSMGGEKFRLYRLDGGHVPDLQGVNITLSCDGGRWAGPCQGVWNYGGFWLYILLLLVGQMCFNTANSITDAITVDIVAEGDYGMQRAWGTIGWGLMGPVSGLAIDWWSGDSTSKDYSPAFLICFVLGAVDVLLSAATLKVPEQKSDNSVLKNLRPLLREPRFFVFCLFVIMNGCFDGVVANFIFVLQEDMAKGTNATSYLKFLQGFTLFVQCTFEAPFMYLFAWFVRRMEVQRITSVVFFLYIFRLLGLALVGAYGPVWATLLVESLNGPCYGLGYTAVVEYAAKISPPGTSNTVQSVVNICYESLGYATASFLGGMLFQRFGGPTLYLIFGVTSILVFILHFISLRLLPPPTEHVNGVKGRPDMDDATNDAEEERLVLDLASPTDTEHHLPEEPKEEGWEKEEETNGEEWEKEVERKEEEQQEDQNKEEKV